MANREASRLTHLADDGAAHMVDVGGKPTSARVARAGARVLTNEATVAAIVEGLVSKGDVLAVARVAGIMAAKRTTELIPLCHSIFLTSVEVSIDVRPEGVIELEAEARSVGQTGVEMEALTAVSVAALTVYDMCKAMDRAMTITDTRLLSKSGGKSGNWERELSP